MVTQTALTEDEHQMLKHIYRSRLNLLIKVVIFLFVSGMFAVFKIGKGGSGLSYVQVIVMNASIVGSFIIITGITIYKKRISRVKQDAKNGVKETVCYAITQKQHFDNTGQFFIGLNHPDYLFHEVDYATWQKLSIGDAYALYRAPLSKYIFNSQGKFSII